MMMTTTTERTNSFIENKLKSISIDCTLLIAINTIKCIMTSREMRKWHSALECISSHDKMLSKGIEISICWI